MTFLRIALCIILEGLLIFAPPVYMLQHSAGQLHLNSTVLLATVPGAGQAQKLCQGEYFSHKPPPEPTVSLVERTEAESGGNHIVCYF